MSTNSNIFSASKLDKLWQNVKEYRQSENFKSVMKACSRFRHLAPYNALLVEMQRPGARFVLSEFDWRKKFDRYIKPNARPIIVMIPFGPVDFLFDISDTYQQDDNYSWNTENDNISSGTEEFEAESVSWLVCERLGVGNPSESYLSNYLKKNEEIPSEVSIEKNLYAAKEIWNMCSLDTNITYRDGLLYKYCEEFKQTVQRVQNNSKK